MQKSISKRLLAGILSIVMVLSLFMTVPAKSEAGNTDNKHVCTIELTGFNASGKRVYKGINSIKLGSTPAAIYDAGLYQVNNGSYNLDLDDTVWITSENEFVFYIQPVDIKEWEQVTSVQVHWNNDELASNSTGYDAAEIAISGDYVFVIVKNTPASSIVSAATIAAVDTTLNYNTYVPTELAFFNYAPVSHATLTWSCTNDGGRTWAYPTAVYVNTGTGKYDTPPTYATANSLGNMLSYYRVETIVSAAPGYKFENKKDAAGNEAYYSQKFAELPDTLLNGRRFEISDVSKDGKTAKLTITGIVVETIANSATAALTSIEFTQEMNFGSDEHVILPADAAAKMPNYFYATINGERKKVEIANLATGRCHWHIYSDPTCVSTSELPADQPLETTNWRLTGASANDIYYYAKLEWDTDWDALNVGGDSELKAIWYALYYEGVYADTVGLLDAVEADRHGFIIKFSVNKAEDRGYSTVIDVPAVPQENVPEMRFDEYYDKAVVHIYGRSVKSYYDQGAGWVEFDGTMDCPKTDVFYKAWSNVDPVNDRGYRVISPVVYTYYNADTASTKQLKQGSVSIDVTAPEWYAVVPKEVNAIAADLDLKNGLDTANALLFWDPMDNIVDWEDGTEVFYPMTSRVETLSAIVYIPVNPGYELTYTPSVKFNGKAATAAEIVKVGNKTYLATTYTFDEITLWHVDKDGASKRIWDDLAQPFAGGTVQKELKPSESAARFYEFLDITWYENGVEFTGDTFAQGKRYTAVVTWDCSKFRILEDCSEKVNLVGKAWLEDLYAANGVKVPSYVTQARITKSKKELTVTYEFPAAEYPKFESVNDINIEVPNGMENDDLYKYVASQLVATINFVGGTTGVKLLDGLYLNKGTELEEEVLSSASGNEYNAKVVEAALKAAYPGTLAYDKNKKAAQDFVLTGYINARNYGAYDEIVKINIHVAGTKSVITFNPNGGVYTGSTILAENGLAYGFKYVPQYIYREGYFFAGWFTEANGGTRVKSATKFDGKTTTLYAHWVKVFTGKVWTLKAASYNAGRLTATATAPKTKVDGYEFSISKDGVNWTVNSQTKNVRYYVGLLSGTYFVKVRAYRLDSAGKFVYGAYSKTQKVVVK